MRSSPCLVIHLYGVFRLDCPSGENITPRSQKAQALLALLVTGTNSARSRSWLQSKLWSDRAPQQAAGSLRQALVQIRTALGEEFQDILKSNRHEVSLDMKRIVVAQPNGQDFLEGIDARDDEFENWLLSKRQETDNIRPVGVSADVASGKKLFVLNYEAFGGEASEWFSRIFLDNVAKHLREFFSADLIVGPGTTLHSGARHINLSAMLQGDILGVRASYEIPAYGKQLWAESRHIQLRGGPPIDHPEALRLLNELVEAIGDSFVQATTSFDDDPDKLCRQAIRMIFSTEKDQVQQADVLLKHAFELDPRGLFLAWRAQLKTIQCIERHNEGDPSTVEEGRHLFEEALRLEPNNSMVLATVANTLGHLCKDHDRALILAKRSVLQNPANPMGWWALSSANSYAGDAKTAYQNARHARNLALLSPHRFWWDSQMFGSAIMLGNLQEAVRHAESSSVLNPAYRPNFRYLIALYANEGREEEALQAAERLKLLEPDFTIDRLVNDRDYPASLLHRTPKLNLDKVAALS